MQRNSAHEIAKNIIRAAKELLGERINNITVYNITDEPYKMFNIKCTLYNYFVLIFNYDRGHFGCNIVFGEDAVPIISSMEWDDGCDFKAYWDGINEEIRLRIPDKYLKAQGWL
ncbi:MAG: hypothetical protein IJZ96_06785 [Lachnospiraceae bacterium]|nr:hypothetical protein [Lachnospiraceae bacterium]MBQ8319226.1 hypothetical protein [Lachnospiraceae bacterium]